MSCAALMALAAFASGPEPRRYLVAVGDNTGDASDQDLRYAEADVDAFVDTLEQIGGVRPEDAVVLRGASSADVLRALSDVGARLAAGSADSGSQLVLYVSSHADAGELHLAGTHLALDDLNAILKGLKASVVLAVVDSCRSGALTRLKGLAPIPGFEIDIRAPEVRGRVVITSSGADEYSQESADYQGSYFTHHLLAALRGAADLRHDGYVTLQEAYTYAYEQTVNTTFATRGGTQHPSYAEELRGQGDLVLSDLSRARGRLVLDLKRPGHWQVMRRRDGALIAEFRKPEGPTQFALAPGVYAVRERAGDLLREAVVDVPSGGAAEVHEQDLASTTLVASVESKGGESNRSELGFFFDVGEAAVGDLPPLLGGTVLLRRDLDRSRFGVVNTWTASVGLDAAGGTGSGEFTEFELGLQAAAGRVWRLKQLRVRAMLEGGVTTVLQSGSSESAGPLGFSFSPFLAARAEAELQVSHRWSVLLTGRVGPSLVEHADGLWIEPKLGFGIGMAYAL